MKVKVASLLLKQQWLILAWINFFDIELLYWLTEYCWDLPALEHFGDELTDHSNISEQNWIWFTLDLVFVIIFCIEQCEESSGCICVYVCVFLS